MTTSVLGLHMARDDPDAVADVISKRRGPLRSLLDEPRDKRDLVAALDMPRSTLDRAIRELEEHGLVEYDGGVYRPTLYGRAALEAHESYRRALGDLSAAAEVVRPLSVDSPLGRELLEGAQVVASAPHAPDDVLARVFDSVREAERVRGVAPVALTGHTDRFREAAVEADGHLELVLAPEVFEVLARTQGDGVVDAIESGDVEFYRGRIPFRFGLWLADDEAGVVVYTGTGIRGVLVNDTEPAVTWATELYDRVRRSADPVTVTDVRDVVRTSG
jgi:predicted transcriptional regulator